MSSVVIKIGSLVIKSLSKPIASQIKLQAREHDRFRHFCISVAQRIHQWDMRFRLGLLQDQAAIDRQIAAEAAERAAEKHKHKKATAMTEAEAHAVDEKVAKAREKAKGDPKPETKRRPRIRPLSEAKAIDSGANFVSETFLLVVAVACLFGERYYSSRKESSRREDVAERLEELEQYEKLARKGMVDMEKEILRLRVKAGEVAPKQGHILPREVYELEETEEGDLKPQEGLFQRVSNYVLGSRKPATEEVAAPTPIPSDPPPEQPKQNKNPAPTLIERVKRLNVLPSSGPGASIQEKSPSAATGPKTPRDSQ